MVVQPAGMVVMPVFEMHKPLELMMQEVVQLGMVQARARIYPAQS